MLETAIASGPVTSKLEIGIGLASHHDPDAAVREAATLAGRRLGSAAPDLAIVVTAGAPAPGAVSVTRDVLGHLDVAGGATCTLLSDHGALRQAALVVCVANADGAASGVASTAGRDLGEAGQAAARLVLAGWPFRARYPRGLALAFARNGVDDTALTFLDSWRSFMGPKMRTVCSVLASPVMYGHSAKAPLASVGCVEASYATGIGYSDGVAPDGTPLPAETLIHGAADAMNTALKRLEGRPARLVVAIESAARHRALGVNGAVEEWAAMRGQMEERGMLVGWLAEHVTGYGRGVQPSAARNALMVVALGDSPRA